MNRYFLLYQAINMAILLFAAPLRAVEEHAADPLLYADPIPVVLTRPLFDAIGLNATQRPLFKVCRIVPLQLGGTNARDNLVLASRSRADDKRRLDTIVLGKVRRNEWTIELAIKTLKEWKP